MVTVFSTGGSGVECHASGVWGLESKVVGQEPESARRWIGTRASRLRTRIFMFINKLTRTKGMDRLEGSEPALNQAAVELPHSKTQHLTTNS